MRVIEAIVSFPIFSIKLPQAFQVADTYLLPPPSTICGALAYSYAISKRTFFEHALEKFAKNTWCFAIPITDIVVSSVILRRIRILDKKDDPLIKVKASERDKALSKFPKNIQDVVREYFDRTGRKTIKIRDVLEVLYDKGLEDYWFLYNSKLFDAMYRRYASTAEVYVAAITTIGDDFIPSFSRMGDTESYVSIREMAVIKEIKKESIGPKENVVVDSYVPMIYRGKTISIPNEPYIIQTMTEPLYLLDRRNRAYYFESVLPLKQSTKRLRRKTIVLFSRTSGVNVRTIEEASLFKYKSSVLKKEVSVLLPKEVSL